MTSFCLKLQSFNPSLGIWEKIFLPSKIAKNKKQGSDFD
jgi:hypothetical protein